MSDVEDTTHSAPPEKAPARRRESSRIKGARSAGGEKPRRDVGKNLGKAKPPGPSAILNSILLFPGRVVATVTLCVILIAAGRFLLTVVRRAL